MIQLGKNPLKVPVIDPNRYIFEAIRYKLPNGKSNGYTELLMLDHQNNLRGRMFIYKAKDEFDVFATFDEGQTFYHVVDSYDGLVEADTALLRVAQPPDSKMYKIWLTEPSPTTCPLCLERHGLIVDSFMEELGVVPPLHPHCNCKLIPMKCLLRDDWILQSFGKVFGNDSSNIVDTSSSGQNPSGLSVNGFDFIKREEGFKSKPYVGSDTDNITIGLGFAIVGGVKKYYSFLTQKEKNDIEALARKLNENPKASFNNVVLDNAELMQQLRNDLSDIYPSMSKEGLWMSESEAVEIFWFRLESEFASSVNIFLERNPQVRLTQYQFDALVDFAYNLGPAYFTNTGSAKGDTIRDFLTAGDYSESESLRAFETYSNSNGRRTKEARLFSSGQYD